MRVFLVHGMGRSPASMLALALFLKRRGHRVSLFGYTVRRHAFDEICERFVDHVRWVRDTEEPGGGPHYAIVGHSLGGVIARASAARLPAGWTRLAMLGTPNHSPALARAGRKSPLYRALTRDTGHRLGDPDFYDALPVPPVPTLVIAGDAGHRLPWMPHRNDRPHDGVVSVEETRLPGADHRVMPLVHTVMMMDPRAMRAVADFIAG